MAPSLLCGKDGSRKQQTDLLQLVHLLPFHAMPYNNALWQSLDDVGVSIALANASEKEKIDEMSSKNLPHGGKVKPVEKVIDELRMGSMILLGDVIAAPGATLEIIGSIVAELSRVIIRGHMLPIG